MLTSRGVITQPLFPTTTNIRNTLAAFKYIKSFPNIHQYHSPLTALPLLLVLSLCCPLSQSEARRLFFLHSEFLPLLRLFFPRLGFSLRLRYTLCCL